MMTLILWRARAWWSSTAWPWLKENWAYVVFFPLGLLALASMLSRERKVEVVSSELTEADRVKAGLLARMNSETEKAAEARDAKVDAAESEREAKKEGLLETQKSRDVEGDDLTDFMKQVGKGVRE